MEESLMIVKSSVEFYPQLPDRYKRCFSGMVDWLLEKMKLVLEINGG